MKMKTNVLRFTLICLLIFSFGLMASADQKADKKAAKRAKLEKELISILGTDSNWKPTVLKALKRDMPCAEVKKHFKGLKCNPAKKYNFPVVKAKKLFGKVKEYKFTFKQGRLQSVTIIFGARLFDAKRFGSVLLEVAQKKWGKLPPAKLNNKIKTWVNADYDTATLSLFQNNWQIKVTMPKRDTGDVTASSLTREQIHNGLTKLLGGPESWKAAAVGKFQRGATCQEVLAVYKTMKGCDAVKNWSFGKVTIKDHDLVHALKFSFNKGELRNCTFIFHRQLNKELFKSISLAVFEAKWGKVKAEKREKDIITIYKTNAGIAQRNFMVDHWEIKFDYPKK